MTEENNTTRALVRALEGDEAIVEVEAGGCGRCHEDGGCGGQHLTQMLCSNAKTYRVDNPLGAQVGERVTVAIAAGSIRRTANLAYGVPLLGVFVGAALGMALGGDGGAVLGAGGGLAAAMFYVRHRAQSGVVDSLGRPHIISRF